MRGKKKAGGASSKFQCTICKTSYKYASSLQLHMKEFHSVNYTAKVDATGWCSRIPLWKCNYSRKGT